MSINGSCLFRQKVGDFVKKNNDVLVILGEEEKKFIYQFGLNDSRKFIKFLVESFCDEMCNINAQLSDIKEYSMIDNISKIKAAAGRIKSDFDMDRDKTLYEQYIVDLESSFSAIIEKAEKEIDAIKKIDGYNIWQRAIGFNHLADALKSHNYLARKFYEAAVMGLPVYYCMCQRISVPASVRVEKEFKQFADYLCSGNTCRIMYDYETGHSEFWLNVRDNMKSLLGDVKKEDIAMIIEEISENDKDGIDDKNFDIDDYEVIF